MGEDKEVITYTKTETLFRDMKGQTRYLINDEVAYSYSDDFSRQRSNGNVRRSLATYVLGKMALASISNSFKNW